LIDLGFSGESVLMSDELVDGCCGLIDLGFFGASVFASNELVDGCCALIDLGFSGESEQLSVEISLGKSIVSETRSRLSRVPGNWALVGEALRRQSKAKNLARTATRKATPSGTKE
jgi:hypothetical protein